MKTKSLAIPAAAQPLLANIRELINSCRERVAVGVNAELSLLYWNVGKRINDEILGNERAEYGKQILLNLSGQLSAEYGKGWSAQHLKQCVWFAKKIPEPQISYTMCNQFSWSHIRWFISMDDPLKREFYIEMCKIEHWSVRALGERINSMLYERTAISKKPEQTIRHDLALLKTAAR